MRFYSCVNEKLRIIKDAQVFQPRLSDPRLCTPNYCAVPLTPNILSRPCESNQVGTLLKSAEHLCCHFVKQRDKHQFSTSACPPHSRSTHLLWGGTWHWCGFFLVGGSVVYGVLTFPFHAKLRVSEYNLAVWLSHTNMTSSSLRKILNCLTMQLF